MGESIAEGTITGWLKEIGQHVDRDEPLFEMSTDKVDAEIPSPIAGTLLEIKVKPGETVAVNTVVAVIGGAEEQVGASQNRVPEPEVSPAAPNVAEKTAVTAVAQGTPGIASVEQRRQTKSSPLVRKIASQNNIDISTLSGTGVGGRVTKVDIMAVVNGGHGTSSASSPVAASIEGAVAVPDMYRPKVYAGDRVEDMTKMRSLISDHMILSRRISSHVQTVWEVDFSKVAELRKHHKASWREQHDVNLTYTSFAMKATVDALKAFPVLNASLDDRRIIYHQEVNLGMAVALDNGLIVPVIHGANELNLLGLTRRLNDLGDRARHKKLRPSEVTDGTFTITNPGVFGNLFGIPVINQPQVAILGMGGVEKRPVVIDDMIAIRTRAYLSLSFDHRLVDGAVADQFMKKIKDSIEDFDESEL